MSRIPLNTGQPRDPSVTFRPMRRTGEDLALFKACFEANGYSKTLEHLRWQYLDNPVGDLLVDLAVAESGPDPYLAAIYAVFPDRFVIQARERNACQSLDTLTDARHRGKGLFVDLARSLYSRAAASGHAFVYGFPSKNSAPGIFKKLGWVPLDPVPFLIKPLRSRYFLNRLPRLAQMTWLPDISLSFRLAIPPRSLRIERLQVFDHATDEIWHEFARQVRVAIQRDHAYLNWRLRSKPGVTYEISGCYEGTRLLGFIAHTVAEKHGGRIAYIVELLFRPGAADVAPLLLRHAIARAREARADAILAWCFPHSLNYASYRSVGFLELPERLRPIELHFGVLPLDEALRPLLAERTNWYLSYCDSDTV